MVYILLDICSNGNIRVLMHALLDYHRHFILQTKHYLSSVPVIHSCKHDCKMCPNTGHSSLCPEKFPRHICSITSYKCGEILLHCFPQKAVPGHNVTPHARAQGTAGLLPGCVGVSSFLSAAVITKNSLRSGGGAHF